MTGPITHPPFVECYAVQAFYMASNLTLSWCLKNRIRSQWENSHCYTIPSFTLSRLPFWPKLGLSISPWYGASLLPRNQRRAAWHQRRSSTLRWNSKRDLHDRISWRRAKQFLLSYCRSKGYRTCLLDPGCKWTTCSVQATRWVRTYSSRSANLEPNSIGSESPPATSQATTREDLERSPLLVSDTVPFQTEKGHRTQEGCEGPYGSCRQTVFHP